MIIVDTKLRNDFLEKNMKIVSYGHSEEKEREIRGTKTDDCPFCQEIDILSLVIPFGMKVLVLMLHEHIFSKGTMGVDCSTGIQVRYYDGD